MNKPSTSPPEPTLRPRLAFLGSSLVLAVLFTWPALHHPFSRLVGGEDPLGDRAGALWLHHHLHEVLTAGAPFPWAESVGFPVGQDLVRTFSNFLDALLAQPLIALFGWPWHYDLMVLLIAWLNLLAGAALARAFTRSWWLALPVGALWAFAPPFYDAMAHGRLIQAFLVPVPLVLLFLWRMAERPGWRPALGLGLSFLLAAASYSFHAYFLGFALVAVVGWQLLRGRGMAWLRSSWALALGLLPAVAVAGLPLWTDSGGSQLQGVSWGTPFPPPERMFSDELLSVSASILDHALPWSQLVVPGVVGAALAGGLVLALLGVAGVAVKIRGRWLWLTLFLCWFGLSLGPYLRGPAGWLRLGGEFVASAPYLAAYRWLPLFSRFHWPDRLLPLALACLVPLAAGALLVLRARWPRLGPGLAALAVVGLAVELGLWGHWPLASEPFALPPCYQALDDEPEGALLELPLRYAGRAMVYQPLHGRPVVNQVGAGFDSHRWSKEYQSFWFASQGVTWLYSLNDYHRMLEGTPQAMADLRERGFGYVVWHRSYLGEALVPEEGSSRLDPVRHGERALGNLQRALGEPICDQGDEVVFALR